MTGGRKEIRNERGSSDKWPAPRDRNIKGNLPVATCSNQQQPLHQTHHHHADGEPPRAPAKYDAPLNPAWRQERN